MLSDDASSLRVLAAMITNLIEAVPEGAYQRSHVTRRLFGREVSMVAHPDYVRAVLTDETNFGHSSVMKRVFAPLTGNGVLSSDGAHWQQQRRYATPAFRHDAVLRLLPTMNAAGEAAADRWLSQPGPVDVSAEMMRATLAVILAALLPPDASIGSDRFAEPLSAYLEQSAWHVGLDLVRLPPWFPYPGRRAGSRAAAQCRALIHAASSPQGLRRRSKLLSNLAERFGPEELVDNLVTFVAAGYETTATALSWALWALSIRPALADAAAAEACAIHGPIGVQELNRLPLIRRIVQETMRLYPPAPVLVRDVRQDCEVAGVHFRKDGIVYLPIVALHRHASAWPEPENFNPNRFLPAAVQARHRFAYLPFGAGPRVCMGATLAMTESVVLLATLLRRIEIQMPGGPAPRPVARITLRPAGGVHLTARPRRAPAACPAITAAAA